jgi:preprotein translocase subunit SecA
MIDLVLRKVFGSKHERDIKRMRPRVAAINALEADVGRLPDEAFRGGPTARAKLRDGTELDDLLPGLRDGPRDGAGALGCGTSTSSSWAAWCSTRARSPRWPPAGQDARGDLPAVLNGLTGRGVHIVTVNDYLAGATRVDGPDLPPAHSRSPSSSTKRPSSTTRSTCRPTALPGLRPCQRRGLSRGHHVRDEQRVRLRLPPRQHALLARELVQRELHYAIVDEVDSILIDEARTR